MLPLQIDYIVIKSDTCGTISHSSINWLLLGLLIYTSNNTFFKMVKANW